MATQRENLIGWRDSARIDWFSQFIKAWIPFNAWMTNNYGELKDSQLLDHLKSGSNVVFNGIIPIFTMQLRQARDSPTGWRIDDPEAREFRQYFAELHRRLEQCDVIGRRGRVSFETVDMGHNPTLIETKTVRRRVLTVQRGVPASGNITISITATTTQSAYTFTQSSHNLSELENDPGFAALTPELQSHLRAMHLLVVPRLNQSVVAPAGTTDALEIGDFHFINDPTKLFTALIDILYLLRNALFHGSITPTDQNNQIYEPAYHLVMRMVKYTI